jgi:hypothetical protein
MRNTLSILVLLVLVSSCSTFQNPQPIDGIRLDSFPSDWQGKYACSAEDSCDIGYYLVTKNTLEFGVEEDIQTTKANYFLENGKHMVKKYVNDLGTIGSIEKHYELTNFEFRNDSIFGTYLNPVLHQLGKNLHLIKSGQVYVLNFGNDSGWFPILIYPLNNEIRMYSIKQKYMDKLKLNDQKQIVENLTVHDINHFFAHKSKYLNIGSKKELFSSNGKTLQLFEVEK